MNMLRVLVVEDHFELQRLMASLLEARGFQVITCSNGGDALANLPAIDPDVLVTDLSMPVLDGERLSRAVRDHPLYAGIPIVVTTASPMDDGQVRRLASLEHTTILAKIDLLTLPAVIERMCSRSHRAPAPRHAVSRLSSTG
jgi:CheY-like chemotaxis protein